MVTFSYFIAELVIGLVTSFYYISMSSYFMKFKKNNYFSSQKLQVIIMIGKFVTSHLLISLSRKTILLNFLHQEKVLLVRKGSLHGFFLY